MILWKELSRRQRLGYKFHRQYGIEQYVLDFYCPRLRLAIEVDGDSHFVPGAEDYDNERQGNIEAYVIQFLRIMNTDVWESIDEVCQMIYEEIEMMKEKGIHRNHERN